MYVLVTYDVSTIDKAGQKRLRKIAKICLNYGQRVQYSVFEMKLEPAQWSVCSATLVETIDPTTDSIRFYHLGNNWMERIDHHGVRRDLNIDGFLSI